MPWAADVSQSPGGSCSWLFPGAAGPSGGPGGTIAAIAFGGASVVPGQELRWTPLGQLGQLFFFKGDSNYRSSWGCWKSTCNITGGTTLQIYPSRNICTQKNCRSSPVRAAKTRLCPRKSGRNVKLFNSFRARAGGMYIILFDSWGLPPLWVFFGPDGLPGTAFGEIQVI